MIPDDIGATLYVARKKTGWSRRRLADAVLKAMTEDERASVPISEATLYRLEKEGVLPSDIQLRLLARFLPIDAADLIRQCNGLRTVEIKCCWEYQHPFAYRGKVWIHIRASKPPADMKDMDYSVYWEPIEHRGQVPITQLQTTGIYLWHFKAIQATTPVIVRTQLPCQVTFGQGEPPAPAVDINWQWRVTAQYFRALPRYGVFWALQAVAVLLAELQMLIYRFLRWLEHLLRFLE